jgi:membrane associated rhomboid family serine protease
MIPLRSTERIRSATVVTAVLIALNVLIFLYQASMSQYGRALFDEAFGVIPDAMSGRLYTLLTSMFLHGGWMHLIGNMLFLWVFGRNIEDLIGPWRFVTFYLVCGMVAAIVQIIVTPYSRVPTIGASGAIAGVMGAYLVKFPKARIVTLVPIFVFLTTMEIPASLMLIWWFVLQFISGLGSLAMVDYSGGGVAFFAHIGGFLAGLLLIRLFPEQKRWRPWYEED